MYFIPQFGAPVATRVTSNEITIPANVVGTKLLTLSPAGYTSTMTTIQVIKNDVVAVAPYNVVAGDRIKVSGIVSGSTETPTYIAILIADVGYLVFGAVTRAAVNTDTVPLSKYADPLAPLAAPYTPVAPNNRLLSVNPTTNAIVPITLSNSTGNNSNSSTPSVFAPDFLSDVVQQVQNGTVVQSLALEGPLFVAYSPTYSPSENTVTHTLIASPLDNKIHIYNGQTHIKELDFEVLCPYAVAGIGTSVATDYSFWVVSRDINRVALYKSTNGQTPVRQFYFDLNSGCLPTNLIVDNANNAYVVCTGTDQIVKVFVDGVTPPTYISLTASSRPTGITVNDLKTHAYVLCSNTSTASVITLATNAVTVINTQKFLSCGVIANSRLYVGSVYSTIFGYYPLTSDTTVGAFVSLSTAYRLIEGMTTNTDRSEVYVLVQHEDAPSLITPIDKAPNGLLSIYTHYAEDLVGGTVVQFPTLGINGLDAASTFRVPSMASTQMWRNGTNSFNSGVFNNTDTLQVRMTIPANNLPVSIPLMFTGGGILFNVEESVAVVSNPLRVAGWMQGG